jgi:hypothetical protein
MPNTNLRQLKADTKVPVFMLMRKYSGREQRHEVVAGAPDARPAVADGATQSLDMKGVSM